MLEHEKDNSGAGVASSDNWEDFDFGEDDFAYYSDLNGGENLTVREPVPVEEEKTDADDLGKDDFDHGAYSEELAGGEHHAGRRRRRGHGKTLKKLYKKGKDSKFAAVMKKVRLPLISAAAVILLAAVGFFGYAYTTIPQDTVMRNVYIEDVNVGGMTYEETLAAVNAAKLFENSEILLTDGTTDFVINGEDVGLSALPEETAQKAIEYCKTGNVIVRAYRAGMLILRPHVIVPAPQLDEEKLNEKLDECGKAMRGERREHYVEFDTTNIAMMRSGCTGYDGNHEAAKEKVVKALNNEQFRNIRVHFDVAPPQDMTLEQMDAMIYKEPADARYEINGNEVTVVPEEVGRYIDKEAVAPLVDKVYEGCEPVGVPFFVSMPEVTADTLKAKLFADTLSTYSTSYSGSTWNRCQNVARAASLINGKVIASGEIFSFNDTVGHRTPENGFFTAKEYVNGESVDGIGGGTCQVSSTLYSAVLYADMGIIERLNHMMAVGYIPLGQDATVADGGVDFRFKNTSRYPVKISASTSGTTITISIIGTAWEPARKVTISNNSTAVGENTVVRSTRYVYENGQLISTDSLNSSTYMPHKKEAAAATEAPAQQVSASSVSETEPAEESGEDE